MIYGKNRTSAILALRRRIVRCAILYLIVSGIETRLRRLNRGAVCRLPLFKDKISHLIKKPNRKCIWRGKRKAVSSLCIENCIFVPPNY